MSGLTEWLSIFTIFTMGSKQQYTVDMSWKIHRILNKFQRLESSSIEIAPGKAITHKELHLIQAIGEIEPINITQLGAHFGVTKSAASQAISKLVQKGLVEKERSSHSGKEYELILTDLGREAYKLHENHHSRNIKEISGRLSSFSMDQIATTSNVLDVIEAILDERLTEE